MQQYEPVEPGSRVSSGLNEEGYTSWQIDGKDVSDADGFGAAINFDGPTRKIFEGTQTVFGGFGEGRASVPGRYVYNHETKQVELAS